jgi:CRISPR-associated endoribonuclease Cas6
MYAEKPLVLPFFTGYVARGLLLHMVRQIDPGVSGSLHELDMRKPYSVTPLRFNRSGRGEKGYILDSRFPCHVDFRFLRDAYSELFLDFFKKQNSVLIFDTPFQIGSMNVDCKSYEALVNESYSVSEFDLDFRTPTYFASMGDTYHWMFPDAMRVFSNLMRCWNMFSEYRRFGKDEYVRFRNWLAKNVGVSRYELRTSLVVMRSKKATGFRGWVTYVSKDKDSEWGRTLLSLARFAEFSNVGGNRTGGFGVTKLQRRISPIRVESKKQ